MAEAAYIKKHIYIASGTYEENVVIDGSISLFGGLSNDGSWIYSDTNMTLIRAVAPVNSRIIAVDGSNMTDETWFGGLTIQAGPAEQGTDGHSTAWIANRAVLIPIPAVNRTAQDRIRRVMTYLGWTETPEGRWVSDLA